MALSTAKESALKHFYLEMENHTNCNFDLQQNLTKKGPFHTIIFKETLFSTVYVYNMKPKKERGAQSKSKYYVKFGNPNYGGMKGLLSKSFKRRYNNKKTREDLHKAAEKLGMKMKPQTTKYDPKSEKLDTNRHKADVELINSSVQDIPEAVSISYIIYANSVFSQIIHF